MKAFRDTNTLLDFTDGFQVYYNYLKPHNSLKGKTPAEAARIDYKAKNWIDICHLPVSEKPKSQGLSRRVIRITPPTPRITPKVGRLAR